MQPKESARSSAGTVSVELVGLTKKYGATIAIDNVSLRIDRGEFVALLGPSGSGKTSVLMIAAGFSDPTSGDIRIDGKSMIGVPPEDRGVGVVFQNYALFPHLRVEQNISFPLEMRKKSKDEIAASVGQALRLVGLEGLGRRYPHELSGGQQQRVALARALVFEPTLLLMDEPLGALDKNLRLQMQQELRALHRDLGTTILFVTHDQDEALALANRVAILHEGKLVQVDRPLNLYREPHSRFVASFMGDCNFLPISELHREDGAWKVRIDGYTGSVPVADSDARSDGPSELAIRPHFMQLDVAGTGGGLAGRVIDAVFLGQITEYVVEVLGGTKVIVRQISRDNAEFLPLGSDVGVTWSWPAARVL